MWVISTIGCYSVVARYPSTDNPEPGVSVRARVREDLENLIECFYPDADLAIEDRDASDYQFSMTMTHEQWATCLWYLSFDVTYHNFKDAVTKAQGKERHDVYLSVWGVLRRGLEKIQGRPPVKVSGGNHGEQLRLRDR